MAMMTLQQALDWVQSRLPDARLVGDGSVQVSRVHTDTRSLQAGDLFIALKGETFDANSMLPQARAQGAVAAIAHHGLVAAGLSGIEVSDTRLALGGRKRAGAGQSARRRAHLQQQPDARHAGRLCYQYREHHH